MKFLIGYGANGPVTNCGGHQVIKKLVDILTDLNQTVVVIGNSFENGKTIQYNPHIGYDKDSTVVIYPEGVVGNPFEGKYVVRWLLYHTYIADKYGTTPADPYTRDSLYKMFGVDGYDIEDSWSHTDEYFYLFDYYKTKRNIKSKKFLSVYNFRLDEFQNMGLNREGYCHLIKKNNVETSFIEKYKSDHIPDGNWPALIEMFNKKKYFLTYDDSTYFICIAALCGCIPIVLYKDKKNDYKEKTPHVKYGVAYGFEELEYATETLHLMRPNLESIESESLQTVKDFINFWEEKIN